MKSNLHFLRPHRKEILIITLISIVTMLGFHMLFDVPISDEIMLNSTDAKGYIEVKNWLLFRGETPYTEIRPLLYPLLILIPTELSGSTGIWILHLTFWLLSIILVYLSVAILTKNKIIGYVAAGLVLCNLSFMASCYQALTENTTTFQIAIITFAIVLLKDRVRSLTFIHTMLLLLVLMTLVKPLFFPVFLTVLLIFTPLFYFKEYKKNPKALIKLILILSPILIQMSIVKIQHDVFTISTIGGKTFTNYYFTQSYVQIEGKERLLALDETNQMTSSEKTSYMWNHSSIYSSNFFNNIANNIKGHPSLLNIPPDNPPKGMIKLMKSINTTLSSVHYIMLLMFFIAGGLFIKLKDWNSLTFLVLLGCIQYYIILTSGLSFWQGDRLTLPMLTIWPVLYSFIFWKFILSIKNRYPRTNSH
jgi:4-amino-4-deoxy-L-arabinose transferase-like glycosyltransferase